jgi:hypothetical protein
MTKIFSAALAKEALQIAHANQDNYIQALLDGAESFIAEQLNVVFGTLDCTEDLPDAADCTVPLYYNAWNRPEGESFLLPKNRPVTALLSVADNWADGAAELALLVGSGLIQRVDSNLRPLGGWPWGAKRYHVHYTAGFATLPPALQQAVLMLVNRAYAARAGEAQSAVLGEKTVFGSFAQSDIVELIRPFSQRWRALC